MDAFDPCDRCQELEQENEILRQQLELKRSIISALEDCRAALLQVIDNLVNEIVSHQEIIDKVANMAEQGIEEHFQGKEQQT